MTVPDPEFHLEALHEKATAGTLAPEERTQLEAHIARCAACQIEKVYRDPADDDPEMAALLEATDRWDRVFEAVEADTATGPVFRSAAASVPPAPVRFRWRARTVAGIATIGAVAGFAAAAVLPVLRGDARDDVAPPAPAAAASVPPTSFPPASSQPLLPLEEPAPLAPPAPTASPPSLPPAPTASAPMSPATLFRAAQAARSRGDRHRAIQLYRQLQARHPDSREAAISKVSLAALMAEDEPGNALSEYDAYLDDDPKGALAEEALAGRARSLSRLGRDREARAAWRQLLRDHPGSFHAAEARRALAAKP